MHAHQRDIIHLSMSSDNENFISGCSKKIHMWNLENEANGGFLLVNKDYSNIDDIITSTEMCEYDSNLLIYSTTTGYFDICDMRISSNTR